MNIAKQKAAEALRDLGLRSMAAVIESSPEVSLASILPIIRGRVASGFRENLANNALRALDDLMRALPHCEGGSDEPVVSAVAGEGQ